MYDRSKNRKHSNINGHMREKCNTKEVILNEYKYMFMVFNATFNNISVYRGSQFYWWKKPEYPEKTTLLSQVTDKLSHYVVSSSPPHERGSNSQL